MGKQPAEKIAHKKKKKVSSSTSDDTTSAALPDNTEKRVRKKKKKIFKRLGSPRKKTDSPKKTTKETPQDMPKKTAREEKDSKPTKETPEDMPKKTAREEKPTKETHDDKKKIKEKGSMPTKETHGDMLKKKTNEAKGSTKSKEKTLDKPQVKNKEQEPKCPMETNPKKPRLDDNAHVQPEHVDGQQPAAKTKDNEEESKKDSEKDIPSLEAAVDGIPTPPDLADQVPQPQQQEALQPPTGKKVYLVEIPGDPNTPAGQEQGKKVYMVEVPEINPYIPVKQLPHVDYRNLREPLPEIGTPEWTERVAAMPALWPFLAPPKYLHLWGRDYCEVPEPRVPGHEHPVPPKVDQPVQATSHAGENTSCHPTPAQPPEVATTTATNEPVAPCDHQPANYEQWQDQPWQDQQWQEQPWQDQQWHLPMVQAPPAQYAQWGSSWDGECTGNEKEKYNYGWSGQHAGHDQTQAGHKSSSEEDIEITEEEPQRNTVPAPKAMPRQRPKSPPGPPPGHVIAKQIAEGTVSAVKMVLNKIGKKKAADV